MDAQKQKDLAKLQRDILDVVCAYVKKNGTLLYSTCTISAIENEDNVAWFLQKHPEFVCEKQCQILPQMGKKDGFFYAKLVRKDAENEK